MKLSIITVNLNNVRGLHKTMESILSQTFNDFEWIVIDGGSTDGSKELLEQNAEHIAYWVSEPDRGIYHAMNKGIAKATGNYLLFLNSGDYLSAEGIIESFIKTKPTSDVIYGNAIIVDKNGKQIDWFIAPDMIRLSYFWNHSLNHQATFFHKRCFQQFLYNENNNIASDLELFMQLLYHGYPFQKWDTFVVCFETGGLSAQHLNIAQAEFAPIVSRVLPSGVKADYKEIIQFRDVDLYKTIRRIIESPRWVRNAARLALFPFKMFLK